METKEIRLAEFKAETFIEDKIREIGSTVGSGVAINALSGGVDSSVVTLIGHRALGDQLKTYFIDNGLMREDEPLHIVSLFNEMGVKVELLDARGDFLNALRGLTDPEEKREAITESFYKDVFGRLVRDTEAKYLLQGTNYTDIEETVAGIKRQHNILEQIGIDPKQRYGYMVLEPLIQIRKPAIRELGKALGLPAELYGRPPFPGPALAARIIGEVTQERINTVRAATKIVEEELAESGAFQYLAVLHEDRVVGIRDGKREFGLQIETRCWDSKDAVTGSPTRLPWNVLERLSDRIVAEVPAVVSVTYNITKKPPSTIEAV